MAFMSEQQEEEKEKEKRSQAEVAFHGKRFL
jgi:hypothetical protein